MFDPLLAETTDGGATWAIVTPPGAVSVAGVVSFDGSVLGSQRMCRLRNHGLGSTRARLALRAGTVSASETHQIRNAGFTQAMVAGSRLILFGQTSGGEIAVSPDGRSWELADPPSACVGDNQLGASPAGTLLDVCSVEVGGGIRAQGGMDVNRLGIGLDPRQPQHLMAASIG